MNKGYAYYDDLKVYGDTEEDRQRVLEILGREGRPSERMFAQRLLEDARTKSGPQNIHSFSRGTFKVMRDEVVKQRGQSKTWWRRLLRSVGFRLLEMERRSY